jgi:hypothetical protein
MMMRRLKDFGPIVLGSWCVVSGGEMLATYCGDRCEAQQAYLDQPHTLHSEAPTQPLVPQIGLLNASSTASISAASSAVLWRFPGGWTWP